MGISGYLKRLGAASFIFFVLLATNAHTKIFTTESYCELRDVALQIEKTYPTSKYVYVGIGRSPAPGIRFFQEIATGLAYNLPLHLPYGELTKIQIKILNDHLTRFLPNSKIFGERGILLIDFANTGATILRTTQLVQKYLPRRVELRAIALSNHTNAASLKNLVKKLPVSIVDLAAYPKLTELFLSSQFDAVAEYDSFHLEHHPGATNSKDLVPLKAYDQLGEELLEYMLNDHTILEPAMKIRACRDKLTVNTHGRAGRSNANLDDLNSWA